ncbi:MULTISPECIES: hypothetical protein [Calothrix]|uniref:Uncharacterized protein n=2 Tax=Calothrix TaxID=1186 RepID=A0ABR8A8G4_9CYAN|nr:MULTISPECIES: hypothetical protein [Calothrix]MBD2196119.1 hypothetical protein [Calothrix parietina FACHB-288]MBD2224770.1 hypothetical protein [Calothrix anomala FACHB-343]
MTIVPSNHLPQTVISPENLAHQRLAAQRMQDVNLLLQNLANSEEATIKLIIDCLYDIGSVNLINRRLRFRPLNRTIKLIARVSKPVFRVIAWHWFQKNCPQLITDWLETKIAFEDPTNLPQEIAVETSPANPYSQLEVERMNREINYLRQQVRWLAGFCIVALSALGVTVTALTRNPDAPLQSTQQIQSQIHP